MTEVAFTKADIEELLSHGMHHIVFYKTDGSVREMVCTKDPSLIPDDKQPSGEGRKAKSDTTIPVYSPQDNGWRSFIVENLIKVEY